MARIGDTAVGQFSPLGGAEGGGINARVRAKAFFLLAAFLLLLGVLEPSNGAVF